MVERHDRGVRSGASAERRAPDALRVVRRAKARRVGTRTDHGCSCLRSIAEVGEEASSSRPRWRGREAEPSGRGVARASRIPVTGMASLDRAKGCGAKRASRTANAQSSVRSQGRASHPPKASWFHRAVASNRVAVSKEPGSTGQLRSLTKDGLCRANARRRPRGSARRATEDVRRRAVGRGSLSRRTQRVTSLRERTRSKGL